MVEHASHRPIELQDGFAAQSHGTLAAETLVRPTRHVHVVGAEIHEKRALRTVGGRGLRGIDPVQGIRHNGVGNVLVFPKRVAATFHIADARNAVDDAHVVAVGGTQAEQLGMGLAGGLAGEVAAIAHFDGCRGIVVAHTAVFDVDTGHAVGRGRHDATILKAECGGGEVDLSVPILLRRATPQAEVPLADGGGGVAGFLEHLGQGELLGTNDHGGIACGHIRAGTTEGIFAGEETIARGRGGGGAGVGIGEARSVGGKAVDVGCFHPVGPVAGEVAIAYIVGHDDQHVGACTGRGERAHAVACRHAGGKQSERKKRESRFVHGMN